MIVDSATINVHNSREVNLRWSHPLYIAKVQEDNKE